MESLVQELRGNVNIAVVQPESFSELSLKSVEMIAKEMKVKGIYVSTNKPYSTASKELKELGVLDEITFVDCASGLCGEHPEEEKVIFLKNPADLTNLSIILDEYFHKLGEGSFLVFDSLSTMLIYTPIDVLTKFTHSLGVKIKSHGIKSLILAVNQEAVKELVNFLSTVADKIMYLTIDEKGNLKRIK